MGPAKLLERDYRTRVIPTLLGVWLCSPTALAQEVADDGFQEMRVAPGLSESADIIELIRPFLMFDASSTEGEPFLRLTVQKSGNGYSFDVTAEHRSEGDATGDQYRGEIIRYEGDRWLLLDLFHRPIRSSTTNSPQTGD